MALHIGTIEHRFVLALSPAKLLLRGVLCDAVRHRGRRGLDERRCVVAGRVAATVRGRDASTLEVPLRRP